MELRRKNANWTKLILNFVKGTVGTEQESVGNRKIGRNKHYKGSARPDKSRVARLATDSKVGSSGKK